MIGHTLDVLEFSKLKDLLSRYASSELALVRIEELHPLTHLDRIRHLLDLCTEAKEVCLTSDAFRFDGLTDIHALLDRASKVGAILEADELLRVSSVAGCARRVRRAMAKLGRLPLLSELTVSLPSFPEFEDRLSQCISPEGEILDHASPELRRIRRQLHTTREGIRSRLERLIKDPQHQKMIQDSVVTLRNDRFVIPLKQDYRGNLQGVVQGQSGSGATLFVEPMDVIESNNALHRLANAERQEIRRILKSLTEELHTLTPEFRVALDILGELDFLAAKARLSIDLDATAPELNTNGFLNLVRARHPLLLMKLRQEPQEDPEQPSEVVPTDVHLGDEFNMLVVTGPNTGGKTIVLKTVGLLTLMAQSGLHIPAGDGSEVGIFSHVFADIGDEQSIEQNLSTFSSHMSQIIHILSQTDRDCLVLLDELGAGTDPTEGTALGMAIMDELQARESRSIITTHYGALKVHAHTSPKVENSSMEFDWHTLRPTYRLRIGVPGSSNALRIAERLGLSDSVITMAQEYIETDHIAVEDLITSMERERRELHQDRQELRELLTDAESKQQAYEELLQQFDDEQQERLRMAEKEAAEIVTSARRLVENTVADIRREQASKESIRQAHTEIDQVRDGLQKGRKRSKKPKQPQNKLTLGDKVRVKTLGRFAEVVSVDPNGKQVKVRLGKMQLSVDVTDLELAEESLNRARVTPSVVDLQYTKRSTVSTSLHLLGMLAEDAIQAVDKYLDDAYLAGLTSVTLVHGKGTGALAAATKELLKEHPQVKLYRRGGRGEGGEGVTIVTLKD